jgi:hypothetical protein
MGALPGSRFLPLSSQLLGNKQFWVIADMAAPARTAIVQVVGKGAATRNALTGEVIS